MRKAYFKDWYGKDCKSVEELISYFNQIIEDNADILKANEIFKLKPKALIAPHAGWIYSGFSANFAYKIAQNSNPKRVVVIGPSHKFPFEGSSITLEEEYETPCGNLQIDTEFYLKAIDANSNPVDYDTQTADVVDYFTLLNLFNKHTLDIDRIDKFLTNSFSLWE